MISPAITRSLILFSLFAIPSVHAQQVKATNLVKTTVAYREVKGHKVLVDVYRPKGNQKRPVLVWLHGGALIMGHREGINYHIRTLAKEKGYALVSFDYRLAPESKLPELISDIEAGFNWLGEEGAKQFNLDTSKIVVTGGSAGGYLTLITGYRVKPRPVGLVALYGYGDLVGDWYSKPSPHKRHNPRPIKADEAARQTDGTIVSDARKRKGNGGLIYLHYRQQGTWPLQVSGFSKNEIAQKIKPYEPTRNVDKTYPHTLLIHGTADTDVPYEQSTMMQEQFRKHGVKHKLISLENGEHGFGGAKLSEINEAYTSMRQFIVAKLGD